MSDIIKLTTDKNGKLIQSIENAIRIFSDDEDLKGIFRFNERADLIYKVKGAPWDDETDIKPRSITDTDYDRIYRYFEQYGFTNQKKIESALRIVAEDNKYEPLREYFLSREGKHDGKSRVETLFIDILGAPDTSYIRETTKLFLLAIVSRTFYPGIKYDYCPILFGGQGIGKSKICEFILPDEDYFTNDLPTNALRDSRSFMEKTQGKSVIEIAELTTFNKSDLEEIKQCITTQIDRGRPAYTKTVHEIKRRCVFIGTTNKTEFLRDATGNRRFLPIRCDREPNTVHPLLFSRDFAEYRDQLWSETLAIFREREKDLSLVLPGYVMDEAKLAQGDALEVDDWSECIDSYIYGQLIPKAIRGKSAKDRISIDTTSMSIYINALGGDARNFDRQISRRISEYFLKNSDIWDRVSCVRVGEYRGRGYRLSGTVTKITSLLKKYKTDANGFLLLSSEEGDDIGSIFAT